MNKETLTFLLDDLPGLAYVGRLHPDWKMEFVSEGCFELTGYHSEALLANRTVAYPQLIHPDDREAVRNQIQSAVAKQTSYRLVYRITTATGREKWVWEQGRVARQQTGEGTLVEGIILDITEQKRLEQTLQERTGLLQLQQVIAAAANESSSIPDAIRSTLELVCAYADWPVGHGYLATDKPTGAGVWHTSDPGRFNPSIFTGDTLPAGLRAKHTAPIITGKQAVGTLEFFAETDAALAPALEQVLRYVGTELGRIIERKHAEDTLHQQERHYRAIIDSTTDNITLVGADGITLYESPSVERLQGFKPEELVGKCVFDDIHPEDAPRIKEIFQQGIAIPNFTASVEYRVQHKDGTWRHCESVGKNLLHDPAIGAILLSTRDITQRKLIEENLRLQSAALAAAANAIVITGADGTIRWVNPAFTKLTGYSADEAVGQNPRVLKSGVVPAETYAAMWRTILAGEVWRGELINRRKDNSLYTEDMTITPVRDETGAITHFIAIKRDITERKAAHDALRASEERYRSLFETMQEGFALCEMIYDDAGKPADFRYIEVNPAFETLTGLRAADAVGSTVRQLIPGIEQSWIDSYGAVASTGQPVEFERYFPALRKRFAVEAFCPKPGQFATIFSDVTERKANEDALREANRSLEQALAELKTAEQHVIEQERLRALGTMASGIAHDFNNSLSAILGFSELLLHRPNLADDREKSRHYLELINTAAKDAGTIVSRLRKFYGHRENEVFAAVDLNQLAQEVVSLTKPRWSAEAQAQGIHIAVETKLARQAMIAGSATDLREALTNLIFNAVDALPTGGTIQLRTSHHGEYICLEVADTGTGMTEDVRRRCLEPFFSTKGEHGTGLGLSMVYGIVQRHGGKLDIESQVGTGTTFKLWLPVAAESKTPVVRRSPAAPRRLRALLADDDAQVRAIIVEFLAGDGHLVTATADGRSALQKLGEEKFDVVIADRAMPGMSGDQLATRIKSFRPKLPVIMLTGFGAMMQAANEMPPGVDYLVSKPVTIEELRNALAQAVG